MQKKETRTLTHLANQNENLNQHLNISVSHPDLHQGMGCDPCLRRTSRSRFACTRARTSILWSSHYAPTLAPFHAKILYLQGEHYLTLRKQLTKIHASQPMP